MGDKRSIRTRKAIHDAFLKLLCCYTYEEISVQKLAHSAGINRKTFYLHYRNLDELLREIQNEMVSTFIDRIAGMEPPYDMARITREFFRHAESMGELGERMVCSGSYRYVAQRVTHNIMEQTWMVQDADEAAKVRLKLIMSFVSESTLAIYRQWVADGRRVPLQEVTELTV